MLRRVRLESGAGFFIMLVVSSVATIIISTLLGLQEYHWPLSSLVFVVSMACFVFVSTADILSIGALFRGFVFYGIMCALMMVGALAYWDGPPLLTGILASPLERIGYFAVGDAPLFASVPIWAVSAFLLSIASLILGSVFRQMITRQ